MKVDLEVIISGYSYEDMTNKPEIMGYCSPIRLGTKIIIEKFLWRNYSIENINDNLFGILIR